MCSLLAHPLCVASISSELCGRSLSLAWTIWSMCWLRCHSFSCLLESLKVACTCSTLITTPNNVMPIHCELDMAWVAGASHALVCRLVALTHLLKKMILVPASSWVWPYGRSLVSSTRATALSLSSRLLVFDLSAFTSADHAATIWSLLMQSLTLSCSCESSRRWSLTLKISCFQRRICSRSIQILGLLDLMDQILLTCIALLVMWVWLPDFRLMRASWFIYIHTAVVHG